MSLLIAAELCWLSAAVSAADSIQLACDGEDVAAVTKETVQLPLRVLSRGGEVRSGGRMQETARVAGLQDVVRSSSRLVLSRPVLADDAERG